MKITKVAIDVLAQLKAVITQIEDPDYSASSVHLSHSTIGQHVRHTLEFFTCLLDNITAGQINYDLRQRDLLIETDRLMALQLIDTIITQLESTRGNESLNLTASYGEGDLCNVTIPTNYFRELAYNIEHATHHMALIKVGVKELCSEVLLPDSFGIASSTMRFHHKDI